MSIIFDIETRPQTQILSELENNYPEFDPDSVAIGNLKDEEKIKKKIVDAGIAHLQKQSELFEKEHKKACLDADLGKLSAIGILHIEDGTREIIDATHNEADCLERFWQIVDGIKGRGQWAFGWNIEGFDLPFLFGRSRLLGVQYDPYMITNYRYFDKCFVDLHKVWTFGSFGKFCSLKKASKALGYEHKKMDVKGGNFYTHWESTDVATKDKAREYLFEDLEQTMAICSATHGLIKGSNKEGIIDDDAFGTR